MHTSCNKEHPSDRDTQRFPYLWAVTRKVSVSSCPDKWLVSKITLNSYCTKKKWYLETLYIVSNVFMLKLHVYFTDLAVQKQCILIYVREPPLM